MQEIQAVADSGRGAWGRFGEHTLLWSCQVGLHSRGGSEFPVGGGRKHTIRPEFPKRLHKIEKILGRGGGGHLTIWPKFPKRLQKI